MHDKPGANMFRDFNPARQKSCDQQAAREQSGITISRDPPCPPFLRGGKKPRLRLGPCRGWALQIGVLRIALALLALALPPGTASADAPVAMYIFPAGGQRGTDVKFRVGGLYLHDACPFEMSGPGVAASSKIIATDTVWFEGPVIPLPDSQQAEDYPRDMAGNVTIAADATVGQRSWRVWTAQGAAPSRPFIVGDLPEVVENEIDGEPIPVGVSLPVTINGRIFPREDVDIWRFEAKAGQTITCACVTTRIGSPFEARLEIRDSQGKRLVESPETASPGVDALVRFTAPRDGTYSVHIFDVKFGGLQHYVYRLTVTAGPFVERVFPLGGRRESKTSFELTGSNLPAGPYEFVLPADAPTRFSTNLGVPGNAGPLLALDVDDLPEVVEREPNDEMSQAEPLATPVVINGRIGRPGDVDCYALRVAKGESLQFDFKAASLGSPLNAVFVLLDSAGKVLNSEDEPHFSDFLKLQTFGQEGVYYVRVLERVASRGSAEFAYRLRIAVPPSPDFRMRLPTDAVSVNRGGETKLKLRLDRIGGFAEPVQLEFENLPPGVAVANPLVAGNAAEIDLVFKADGAAPVDARPVRVRGTAMIGGNPASRQATFVAQTPDGLTADNVLVAVALPAPFKVKGIYEVKYAQRGGKFVRHFSVDRGGFAGPLSVRLADRQTRHLQGVRGQTIEVPAGVSEFDYPVFLPPWMEIGRTSRTVVMAVGEVTDPDGSRHKVSFTSANQSEQIVALVDPGQLSIELDRQTAVAAPGESTNLSIQIGRGQGVGVSVKVELVVADHIHGVSAEPITLLADQTAGTLTIRFAAGRSGPFNMPLLVRATAMKGENEPVVAETKLEIVEPR